MTATHYEEHRIVRRLLRRRSEGVVLPRPSESLLYLLASATGVGLLALLSPELLWAMAIVAAIWVTGSGR